MFKANSQSFMQTIVGLEVKEFSRSFDPNKMVEHGEDSFFEGNVLFKTLPFRTSFQNLIQSSKVITDRKKLKDNRYPGVTHYRQLMDAVINELCTVAKNSTFENGMQIIHKAKTHMGENFYGALLISSKTIINPLHPLVAMSILDNREYMNSKKFRVVIYGYPNRKEMDKIYKTDTADKDLIQRNISDMIGCFTNTIDSEIRVNGYDIADNGNIKMKYQVKKHEDEDDNNDYMIVAHQILTKGTVCPYYGTSVIKMGNHSTGMNVSPMISCNISHDTHYNNGSAFDSPEIKDKKDINVRYSSVCCGSLNNKTLKGLRSLTHSNGSSPYNTSIITDGSLAYVDACNNMSINIYIMAKILNEIEKPIVITSTHKIGGKLVNRLGEKNINDLFNILSSDGIILTKEQKIDLAHVRHRLETLNKKKESETKDNG